MNVDGRRAIVAERIRRALPYVGAKQNRREAPDCGLKYMPRDIAFAKMRAMVEGCISSCAGNWS